MFTLGYYEFLRNIKKNIFTVILLVILYIVAYMTVSTIYEHNRTLVPVKRDIDSTGILIDNFSENTELMQKMIKVEDVYKRIDMNVGYKSLHGNACDHYVGDDSDYKVMLTSGKYCNKVSKKDGMVRALACDAMGLKAGDTYVSPYDGTILYVTGTFSPDEPIYVLKGGNKNSDSRGHMQFFITYNSEKNTDEYNLFVVNPDDVPSEWNSRYILIDFEDDITEEEFEYNRTIIREELDLEYKRDYVSTESIYNNYTSISKIKLIPIIMAFIVICIYSLFSLVSSASITCSYEKRNYGIYFMTGNTWKGMIVLTTIHWAIVFVLSMFIATCGILIIKHTGFIKGLSMDFAPVHIPVMAGIIIIQLFAANIIPWRMLRNTRPVTIVREAGH